MQTNVQALHRLGHGRAEVSTMYTEYSTGRTREPPGSYRDRLVFLGPGPSRSAGHPVHHATGRVSQLSQGI